MLFFIHHIHNLLIFSESSIPSSGAEETCDEQAGEADDEQSDFFHEFHDGPTYGIPSKQSLVFFLIMQ